MKCNSLRFLGMKRLKVTVRSGFSLPDRKFSHDSATRTGVHERMNVLENPCIKKLLKYV